MSKREHQETNMGMLWGLVIGSAVSTILVVMTGDPYFYGLTGVGLALGLGSALEGREGSDEAEAAGTGND